MKYLSLLLAVLLCAAALSGCGSGSAEAVPLSFAESASIEKITSLNGKAVTLTGYMATLSPLSGEYIYLMNLPYQSCPFCVPNTQQLSNTMAVYAAKGKKFEFTERPVKVTGKIELGDFTDEYGYTYNYRIVDATYEPVDLSQVSEELALYEALAADGVVSDVNGMFDYVLFVCDWPEYQGSYTDDNGVRVPYYLYPGDAENALKDELQFGKQAAEGYFPGLVKRVQAVSPDKLSDLVSIIQDAQTLEQYARAQLAAGEYQYDPQKDQYTLNDAAGMLDRFYSLYGRFSNWLTRYQI